MGDGLPEFRPGLPAVQLESDIRQTLQHFANCGVDGVPASFGAAGGQPEFKRYAQSAGDLESCRSRRHQVFERACRAKGSNAKRATSKGMLRAHRLRFQIIQIRKIGAGRSVGGIDPIAEAPRIPRKMDVVRSELELDHFAHQLYSIAIRLQKTDVRVTSNGEVSVGEIARKPLQFD